MPNLKNDKLLLLLCSVFWSVVNLVVSFQQESLNRDISNVREYGCQWYGGTSAKLLCNCHQGAKVKKSYIGQLILEQTKSLNILILVRI